MVDRKDEGNPGGSSARAWTASDQVIVVEHHNGTALERIELLERSREDDVEIDILSDPEGSFVGERTERRERADDVPREPATVVIGLIEREPGAWRTTIRLSVVDVVGPALAA